MGFGSVLGQSTDTSEIEQQIQDVKNNYVPKSGTTMTGALNMGNNKISGVANGTAANDVVTVGQLQASSGETLFNGALKKIGHYSGVIKDAESFTLGEFNNIGIVLLSIRIVPSSGNALTTFVPIMTWFDGYSSRNEYHRIYLPVSLPTIFPNTQGSGTVRWDNFVTVSFGYYDNIGRVNISHTGTTAHYYDITAYSY